MLVPPLLFKVFLKHYELVFLQSLDGYHLRPVHSKHIEEQFRFFC